MRNNSKKTEHLDFFSFLFFLSCISLLSFILVGSFFLLVALLLVVSLAVVGLPEVRLIIVSMQARSSFFPSKSSHSKSPHNLHSRYANNPNNVCIKGLHTPSSSHFCFVWQPQFLFLLVAGIFLFIHFFSFFCRLFFHNPSLSPFIACSLNNGDCAGLEYP